MKNPQTGILVTLPGKEVGRVTVDMTGGDTPETEYAVVTLSQGDVDASNIANYVIEEIK